MSSGRGNTNSSYNLKLSLSAAELLAPVASRWHYFYNQQQKMNVEGDSVRAHISLDGLFSTILNLVCSWCWHLSPMKNPVGNLDRRESDC